MAIIKKHGSCDGALEESPLRLFSINSVFEPTRVLLYPRHFNYGRSIDDIRKVFGQYLLLEGAVTMEQLREALQLMEREHRVLGQLAVEEKLLTAEQANEINQEQLNRDLPFGKLAIEQGLALEEQVQALVKNPE